MWNFLLKDFERPGISHQPHIFRTVKPLVSRIQQQKLLADGGFAYVYSGLDADSGDRMGSMWTTDTMDTILPASSSHVRAVRSGWPFEEFCCRTRRRSPKPRRDTARHRKTTTPGLKLVDIWWTSGGLCWILSAGWNWSAWKPLRPSAHCALSRRADLRARPGYFFGNCAIATGNVLVMSPFLRLNSGGRNKLCSVNVCKCNLVHIAVLWSWCFGWGTHISYIFLHGFCHQTKILYFWVFQCFSSCSATSGAGSSEAVYIFAPGLNTAILFKRCELVIACSESKHVAKDTETDSRTKMT